MGILARRKGRWGRARRLAGVGLLSLVTSLVALPAAAAHADGNWRPITARWDGKCIDMRSQTGTGNGSLAQQYHCTGVAEQQFQPLYVGSYIEIQNQKSGRCLRPAGGSTLSGALIEQWDCDFNDLSQQWNVFDPGANSTGARWMVNRASGKCVELPGWGDKDGLLLATSDCVLGWKQYWFGL